MNNSELAESLTAHIQNMLDLTSQLNDTIEQENQLKTFSSIFSSGRNGMYLIFEPKI